MNLVDLSGRQDERSVLTVLRQSHGSEAALNEVRAHYQVLARSLIDALAERMGADEVVAETDDDAVGFYRRCGFVVENAQPKFGRARYWCVRKSN